MKSKRGRENEGRPTTYTRRLGLEICSRIALGEAVRNICADDTMPASSTIYLWLLDEDKKEFSDNYHRARNIQAELMFEELLEIADDGTNDWMERRGETVEDKEVTNRSKLRVETRKWYLSKVLPKKFGDKLDLTSGGEKLPTPILPMVELNKDGEDKGTNKKVQ